VQEVTRLYRRDDLPDEDCWVRGSGWCLAYRDRANVVIGVKMKGLLTEIDAVRAASSVVMMISAYRR